MLILILLLLTGTRNSVDCVDGSIVEDIECFDLADVTFERSFDGSQDNESSECFKCPLEKVILSFLWHRASIKMCIVVVSTFWFTKKYCYNNLILFRDRKSVV